jgi:hypothetical protein
VILFKHSIFLTLALTLVLAGPAEAAKRVFSYDPANDFTARTAGPLTFEFNQRLIFTTVLNIQSTQGHANAALKPVSEGVLGGGGLSGLIGSTSHERDLYEVVPVGEGADLIRAFCPGSKRAWLAFGQLAFEKDLRIQVLGDDPHGKHARLCETLDFSFHGEWKMPPGRNVPLNDLPQPKFPY